MYMYMYMYNIILMLYLVKDCMLSGRKVATYLVQLVLL